MSFSESDLRLPGDGAVDQPVLRWNNGVWELRGSRCPQCGRHAYPARVLCPDDGSACVEVTLSPEGTVYAAAQIHLGPVGFATPYWVGWVDLPEGVRVFTILDVPEGTTAEPGRSATLAPRVVRNQPHPTLGPVYKLRD